MTAAQLQSLINGGMVTRWSTLGKALDRAQTQKYWTNVLLGCDGRYWVPATRRVEQQLAAAGYEAAL